MAKGMHSFTLSGPVEYMHTYLSAMLCLSTPLLCYIISFLYTSNFVVTWCTSI